MKKLISVLLSAIMLTTITAGIDFSAYAADGAYDTAAKSNIFVVGDTVSGTFSKEDITDFNKFTISESGRVSFAFTGNVFYDKTGVGFGFSILDSKGESLQEVEVSYDSNLGYSYQEYKIDLTAGTYYVKIYSFSGYGLYGQSAGTGSYVFTSKFTSANETFSENEVTNNNFIGSANPISLNNEYNGQIAMNDKVDFYKFTVAKGVYNINLTANFCGYSYVNHCGISFEILTLTGNSIASNSIYYDSNKGYASGTSKVELDAGTYCIKLFSKEKILTGNYKISISDANKKVVVSKPGKVSLKSVKAVGKKKIKVSWGKVSAASGYQVIWAKDKSCKKINAKKYVSGINSTSCTGKNFTKGKKYYVRVRAYKNVNGKKIYGKWSSVKSVKAK